MRRADIENVDEAPGVKVSPTTTTFLRKVKILFVIGMALLACGLGVIVSHSRNTRDATASPGNSNIFDGHSDIGREDMWQDCGPTAWPQLVGIAVNRARDVILQENRCVAYVEVVIDNDVDNSANENSRNKGGGSNARAESNNSAVDNVVNVTVETTAGHGGKLQYDPERVRLYMNEDTGKVTRVPTVGDVWEACGPTAWPELVGVNVNEARETILQENSCVSNVEILMDGDRESVSRDFDPERVRVYMDPDTGAVAQIPTVGN